MNYQANKTINTLYLLLKTAVNGGIPMPKKTGNQRPFIESLIQLGYIKTTVVTNRIYITDSGRAYLDKLIRENKMLS